MQTLQLETSQLVAKSRALLISICILAVSTSAQAAWFAYGDFNGWSQFDPLVHQGGDYYTGAITGLFDGTDFEFKIGDESFLTSAPVTNGRVRTDVNGEIHFNFWDNTSWSDGWQPSNARRVGYVDHNSFDWEIMSSFNGWTAPLVLVDQGNGLHKGTFSLPAGSHLFKFRSQGDWGTSVGSDFGNNAANNLVTVNSAGDEWTFELDLPNGRWRTSTTAPPPPPPALNGSRIGKPFGAPVAVQTVNTTFGDNNSALTQKGSELNAAYARVAQGKLHLLLTGNLEDNFNKLVLFFDSKAGGQNAIDTDTNYGGSNPVTDPSPYPGDPGMFAKMGGSASILAPAPQATFDAGFAADYALVLRHGHDGAQNRFDVDYAVLGGGAGASSQYLGVFNPTLANGGATGGGVGFANSQPIQIGFNNTNDAGIGEGTGAADQVAATAVNTGVEISISLADLGNPALGDTIKITAFITNSTHDFVSNQFLGGLEAGQTSLGSDGLSNHYPGETSFNLNNFAGDQFFTILVVPEPSSMILLMPPLFAALARRKRA